ncbi:MAG TPA: bifunctional methylenetetrahydrofolate dehydrogenase/methenyltetrahydrofolate cyclohydrolase FolD [Burkholderiales bacterium]|nr:bifunctional methylenetetrahydrofolate dehydrogenase/methenyltetrahydrofolate cyclohydrolase FolD [Burkholderiales bacterium]
MKVPEAVVLDGAAAAREVYSRLKERTAALARLGVRPGLAAVLVGENPASRIYLRNKARACEEIGVRSELHSLEAGCAQEALRAKLEALNRDPHVHGILLQLPLPPHLDAAAAMQAVAPEKDVDGFTWANLGALVAGRPLYEPCTPKGVLALLERAGIAVEGRQAVVIGRSTIVGKPMALMLIARGATVTVCHSRTPDLAAHTRRADILVVAAGRPRLVTADMVKPGAAVMDVGINRIEGGGIVGDVDFAGVRGVAGWITPVPGGVGPMTVAMVVANTVQAAERAARAQQ